MEWRQARGIESASTSPGKERLGHRPGRPALILYLDTSSLIKLYVEESGSSDIESLVGQASLVCTSVVAYPFDDRLNGAAQAETAARGPAAGSA